MANGIAVGLADSLYDLALSGTAYAGNSAVYMQLHTGAPGSAGTANVASNSTRQQVTFAAASAGSKVSNAQVQWTNVPTTETYADFTLWSAAAGGTFLLSGSVTGGAVTAGDTFQIPSGSVTISQTTAS